MVDCVHMWFTDDYPPRCRICGEEQPTGPVRFWGLCQTCRTKTRPGYTFGEVDRSAIEDGWECHPMGSSAKKVLLCPKCRTK
jgi:hypothetical protein